MDDGGLTLGGDAGQQQLVSSVHVGQIAGPLRVPLAVPAAKLAGDVVLVLAERVEAGGGEVDGVDRGHRVDDRLAGVPASLRRQHGFGCRGITDHVAVDESHDVERRAIDGYVLAEAERWRHRHCGVLQAGDDAVLAAHVVRAGQHVAERRAPQHGAGPVRAGHGECQVGVPPGDQVELERALGAMDVSFEPGGDRRNIDPWRVDHPRTRYPPVRSYPSPPRHAYRT